jgi:hypothetical protein
MKKIYSLVLTLFLFSTVQAQVITISDSNFKAKLLEANSNNEIARDFLGNNYFKIDANNNGEIDIDEASKVGSLNLNFSNITSLEGISSFVNLKNLRCAVNQIATLDVNALTNLQELDCQSNKINYLNISGLKFLITIECRQNFLNSINLSDLPQLQALDCSTNILTNLDLSNIKNIFNLNCANNKLTTLNLNDLKTLIDLDCSDNQLNSIYIKNGHDGKYKLLNFDKNPNLEFICTDDLQSPVFQTFASQYNYKNCVINSYCSFTPGGTFYTLKGKTILDSNNNGCDTSDLSYSNFNFSISDGTNKGNIISNSTGDYNIPVGEGTHTITPVFENPNYFTISPTSININFPTAASPFTQDFCITPNGTHNDLEVTILPLLPARPGFDATYKIIYKNKGNTILSGAVSLTFNDAVLDYVSAIPVINNQVTDKLTWDYTNLKPYESREITVTLNVNSPMETPAVNIDDRLSFNALINPVTGDEKPVDNSSALRQKVVGSYDPNDKTCLEGDVITPSLIGEYVNYLIRFENTGTYPAQNIVVKDLIDLTKFDISTLVPTKASHEFVTKISEGNKVEFIFENINLPFDNATNDGYIAFKIKTLPTLVVGDSFANEANIYFDYNFPILTNKATSTFKTLGTSDFEFSNYFSVYPNPVNDILNIGLKNSIEVQSMAVYDILGQLVIAVPNAQTISKIDVSKLTTGNYFLKTNTDKGTSSVKFIKN